MFRKAWFTATVASTAWLLSVCSANANLIAYWDFDSDYAATVGGATYDATPANGASISNAQTKWGSGSAKFSRASSQYATTTASPIPAGTFSYSYWFYLDVTATGPGADRQYATLVSGGAGDAYTAFFNIDGDDGAGPGNDDDIGVIRSAGTLAAPAVIFPFANPTNHQEWKNLIVTSTYDSVGNQTTLEGFLNGVSVGSNTQNGKPLASDFLVFGADRGLAGRFWEGYIDDVAIYDHVLSGSEIAGLQLGPAIVPEPTSIAIMAIGLVVLLPRLFRSRNC